MVVILVALLVLIALLVRLLYMSWHFGFTRHESVADIAGALVLVFFALAAVVLAALGGDA